MDSNRYDLNGNTQNNNVSSTLILHVLITFLTGGLYYFFWAFDVMKTIDKDNEKQSPIILEILGMIFFPPFLWVWTYLTAKNIRGYANKRGMEIFDGFEIIAIVLCTIIPFFNFIFMDYFFVKAKNLPIKAEEEFETDEFEEQENENTEFSTVDEIYEYVDDEEPKQVRIKIEPHVGIVDELREYKKLLDRGLMTEEEFEIKKKELLDL